MDLVDRPPGSSSGGSAQATKKENWIASVRNGSSGLPVLQAYNGRPNAFTPDNRWNLNARCLFSEGTLRRLRVGGGFRRRAPASIGFGVQTGNRVAVPDVEIIQRGKTETAIDPSLGYNGKSGWLVNRSCNLGLNVRNASRRTNMWPGAGTSSREIP